MNLTLQFMSHTEIETLSSQVRIKKLIDLVKQNKIVLLEGKLKKEEEIDLIKATMEQINENFKGIEIGSIEPTNKRNVNFLTSFRSNMIDMLLGDRRGITIIGPASIVREIKQDPEKIQLFTQAARSGKSVKVSSRKSKRRK